MEKTRSYLPGKCRPFFFFDDNTHTQTRVLYLFFVLVASTRRRGLRAGDEDDEEVVRADFARDACRKSDAEKRQVQLDSRSSFFLYVRFCRAFFCALLRRATRDVEKIRRRRRRHAISLFDGTKNRYRAFSKYNDKPGTGKTGYFDIPPNNYPFYMEEEK